MLLPKFTTKNTTTGNLSTQFEENALTPNQLNHIKGGEDHDIVIDFNAREL